MTTALVSDLFDFLKQSPTCYHVVDTLKKALTAHGFSELCEGNRWQLKAGGRYFVTRNDSSLMAFSIPRSDFTGFQLVASHSDSPCFKLKEMPELEAAGNYLKLNVEKYGGLLHASWLDRPLSVAGRVIVRQGDAFETRLFDAARDLAIIPSLAIHFDRSANEGKTYNPQVDLLPVVGEASTKGALFQLITDTLQVEPDSIAGADLFLYNRMVPVIWGLNREYIAAPRLDDLECAYVSFRAFLETENTQSVPVFALFDNEEVGSSTKQGASGTFLKDTLLRIHLSLGHSREDYLQSLSSSFMVSADNAHAIHPHHPEKSDAVNRPVLNGGVVIKHNASQRYTTDAVSAALFKAVCEKAGTPWQTFHNRSDMVGGSTLGNLSSLQVSVNAVDIGLAQLAMHSAYECAGIKDPELLLAALQEFYACSIRHTASGRFVLSR